MSNSAERMQTLRKRRREGLIYLAVEAREADLVYALEQAGLLNKDMADNHVEITRATQRLIEIISRGDQL
jgi:hypothetical protein